MQDPTHFASRTQLLGRKAVSYAAESVTTEAAMLAIQTVRKMAWRCFARRGICCGGII